MSSFPPIADYAFLSDCEVSCLVAPDSAVEWLCLPRPDSPSVFGAMLDRKAGSFRFAPQNAGHPHDRRYVPGTMVAETTWHTPTGWLLVKDLLVMGPSSEGTRRPDYRRAPGESVASGSLLRVATCTDGQVDLAVDCIPNFDYGRHGGHFDYVGEGYGTLAVKDPSSDLTLTLTSNLQLETMGQRCMGQGTLRKGESAYVALSWGAQPVESLDDAHSAVTVTEQSWRDWLRAAHIPDHPWRRYIERSALTLKGLSYAPTGAIMAAGTTGLPETPGGERNWDYRFTWIRDSCFGLRSLYEMGFTWEAIHFFAFVLEAVLGGEEADSSTTPHLQIMYGIGGERDLTEHLLEHLSGWRNSKPVRIGNAAYDQQQLDVWGMLLDAIWTQTQRSNTQMAEATWEAVATLVDQAVASRHEPDQGLWEVRGPPQQFTQSKVMCWVAVDRGVRLAEERGDDKRAKQWKKIAEEIKAEVLKQGVSDKGVFKQSYVTDDLDASLLLIPILGFLPPDDARVRDTVLAIADHLTEDGLVLRYRTDTTDTGFKGKEGTFNICSFWLVTSLAMIGELDRARALCEKLLSFAGPMLLYAEELDATTGQQLGNFPQAFTHLALIQAIYQLIDAEQGVASV
jgi:GH15 family glucan-1,4-alpha-glucosidase